LAIRILLAIGISNKIWIFFGKGGGKWLLDPKSKKMADKKTYFLLNFQFPIISRNPLRNEISHFWGSKIGRILQVLGQPTHPYKKKNLQILFDIGIGNKMS